MNENGLYHVVGVAGVGMSAVAQLLLIQGNSVTGSDRDHDNGKDLEAIRVLQAAGVRILPQDGSAVSADSTAVVVSTAIEDDNPELVRARELGIPVVHRADILADLAKDHTVVGVAGTSGKSSVTAMIGWILTELGCDPMVINGAIVPAWRTPSCLGNVRSGSSNIWVLELDESDKSLLKFTPDWAVLTNISADHFGLRETEEVFEDFCSNVKRDVIKPADVAEAADTFQPELTVTSSTFVYSNVPFEVNLPGRHNAENALCAAMLCQKLGHDLTQIAAAMKSFPGIHRRLEKVGFARGVTVIDDYAHNPAKIAAALSAVLPHSAHVIAIWQPHGFAPLAAMEEELTDVFASLCGSDNPVIILPVYYAGGTTSRQTTSGVLVDRLLTRGVSASLAASHADAVGKVASIAGAGDVVLLMGARDPELPSVAHKLAAALA